ncbi:MAG: phage major capsid domain-containing protein, partial [Candidatus Fonsibacter sp.]
TSPAKRSRRYRRARQIMFYNVAVPTLDTIISREVLWKSTVTLKVTTEFRPTGTYAMNYGVTDALAPFPLHTLVHVMSATINNNTVSFNVQ